MILAWRSIQISCKAFVSAELPNFFSSCGKHRRWGEWRRLTSPGGCVLTTLDPTHHPRPGEGQYLSLSAALLCVLAHQLGSSKLLNHFFWRTKYFYFNLIWGLFIFHPCILSAFFAISSLVFQLFFFWILFIFLYSRFLLVIHFIHISVYMSIPISQFIPPPPPPATFPPWCPYVCSLWRTKHFYTEWNFFSVMKECLISLVLQFSREIENFLRKPCWRKLGECLFNIFHWLKQLVFNVQCFKMNSFYIFLLINE